MTPTDRVRAALKHMRDDAMVMESEEGYKIAIETLALLDGHVLVPIEPLDQKGNIAGYDSYAKTYRAMIAPYVKGE